MSPPSRPIRAVPRAARPRRMLASAGVALLVLACVGTSCSGPSPDAQAGATDELGEVPEEAAPSQDDTTTNTLFASAATPSSSQSELPATEVGCGGFDDLSPKVALEWVGVSQTEDLVVDLHQTTAGETAALPVLSVTNPSPEPASLEFELRILGTGVPLISLVGGTQIDSSETTSVLIELDDATVDVLEATEYSAQITVVARIAESELPGGFVSPPLYAHVTDGKLAVYDHVGLTARHQAGDLYGHYYADLLEVEQSHLSRISRGVAAAASDAEVGSETGEEP